METQIVDFVPFLAQKAGDFILDRWHDDFFVDKKSEFDLVTSVDKEVEELIIGEIKSAYPTFGIIAEESAYESGGDFGDLSKCPYIWIIDPIDGTTNFSHGFPFYCVSIALFKNTNYSESKNYDYIEGEIVAGAVYAPKLNEFFTAVKGQGAFLNEVPINCSKVSKISEAMVATGFSPYDREKNLPNFTKALKKVQAVRRTGSAAMDLCYLAMGRLDAFWEYDLKPWDIAAGSLIAKEAGAVVSDSNGNQLDLFGGDILATNKKIHKNFIKIFN